ncbi:hypothetical protein [Pluralibacter gergoviae]|uniref:hypothetical protein n=1 Tax=Pluralibacter gergoviae TaxID=61647 RepID=UPI000AFFEB55|nr:hypothetical protein [Pluralibacter gergoviae]
MDNAQRHKMLLAKIRQHQSATREGNLVIPDLFGLSLINTEDTQFIENNDMAAAYIGEFYNYEVNDSDIAEITNLIANMDAESGVNSIMEPVFLGLIDGTMRSFKLGSKQGITVSRIYNECKVFSYAKPLSNTTIDSYTEQFNEQVNIATFDKRSAYYDGKMTRDGNVTTMRKCSDPIKEKYFGDENTARDGYEPDSIIYKNKKHANSESLPGQAAQADHVVPCAELCKNLKRNKALTVDDIKDIINIEENIVITSQANNAGGNKAKHDLTRDELQQQIDQGYALSKNKKKKIILTAKDKEVKANQIKKMDEAKIALDEKTNETVWGNVKSNREVQQRLAVDAGNAAGHQLLGEVILFAIKPLYYELNDCIRNGIEDGIAANSFKEALKERFGRMRIHIMEKAASLLKDGLLSFFKNFISMLLEGILNCFVGVFKKIARVVKEGVKILIQITPILRDSNKSPEQKGDAILKLIAGSVTVFAGIAIESWLSGMGEPLSIIMASFLSAVLTALTMYALDKMDLFKINKKLRTQRVSEILNLDIENTEHEIIGSLALLT